MRSWKSQCFPSLIGWFLLLVSGYWEEEHSYSQRSWQRYQREVLHELGCRDEDEDADDGDKCDSD